MSKVRLFGKKRGPLLLSLPDPENLPFLVVSLDFFVPSGSRKSLLLLCVFGPWVFFPLLVSGCGDVLHKSQQRTRGRDLRSCLWQDQIRWLLSKSGNLVVVRFGNLAPFRPENCFRPKIGPEIGPGPCAPPST